MHNNQGCVVRGKKAGHTDNEDTTTMQFMPYFVLTCQSVVHMNWNFFFPVIFFCTSLSLSK